MSETSEINHSKKARLGRGLGSLLGGAQQEPSPAASPKPVQVSKATPPSPAVETVPPELRVWTIAIDKLQPNEYQPRQRFNKESLEELAQSIRQNGILQPITARKLKSGQLEIIAGERRWRSAQLAGMHEVPVIIKESTDKESLELAIIENVQREDLNPIDEAEAYQRLSSEFNFTQQQIAEKVGKDRVTVANAIRLLALPFQIKEMVVKSEISVGHAKVLLGINDPKVMRDMADVIPKLNLSVRALEKMIKNKATESEELKKVDPKTGAKAQLVANLSQALQKRLGTKVKIDYNGGKGQIVIQFYTDDQLNQISEAIQNL